VVRSARGKSWGCDSVVQGRGDEGQRSPPHARTYSGWSIMPTMKDTAAAAMRISRMTSLNDSKNRTQKPAKGGSGNTWATQGRARVGAANTRTARGGVGQQHRDTDDPRSSVWRGSGWGKEAAPTHTQHAPRTLAP
jgi:hypothetical protein